MWTYYWNIALPPPALLAVLWGWSAVVNTKETLSLHLLRYKCTGSNWMYFVMRNGKHYNISEYQTFWWDFCSITPVIILEKWHIILFLYLWNYNVELWIIQLCWNYYRVSINPGQNGDCHKSRFCDWKCTRKPLPR